MNRHTFPLVAALFALILSASILFPLSADALPSFARQTGFSCATCHTVFPELKPFGRAFKMGGYTFSAGSREYKIPIAAMIQLSYTDLGSDDDIVEDNVAPFSSQQDSQNAKINIPQAASIYYGGRIANRIGAFAQLTYDGTSNDIALDMTDIRFADNVSLGGRNFTYGFTINNSPTLTDLWNTTPAFGFPWASSAVAPAPAASTVIDGGLDQMVGGIGAYASWADWIYVEADVYRTTNDGIARPMGAGTTPDTITDGAVPYWRVALFHGWGSHNFEIGTYGLQADIYPGPTDQGPTDRFTDTAFDFQYQFLKSPHNFSLETTYIHENQDWNASYALGNTSRQSSDLNTYKINASYFFDSHFGPIGGTVGYFTTTGDSDPVLYSPAAVDGSRIGSPDSRGYIFEVDYVFREKYKFAVQYTIYDKFNGSSSNYDGFGRDASDNNTLYFLAWWMF